MGKPTDLASVLRQINAAPPSGRIPYWPRRRIEAIEAEIAALEREAAAARAGKGTTRS